MHLLPWRALQKFLQVEYHVEVKVSCGKTRRTTAGQAIQAGWAEGRG